MTDTTGPGAEAAGGGDGLSSDEARRRLRTEGPNRLEAVPATARWRRRLGPLLDPMVLLLLAAAPTYFAIGETVDGVVALVALIPVVGAGWLLEARAERSLDELRAMSARTATVRRDGRTATIPADEVVPGDLLVLREGDVVPADGRVVDATQLDLDESSLTGESLPVAKSIDGDVDVWAGTTVVSGAATVTVTATGGRTRFGHVGALLAGATPPRTPFQQALARLVTRLAVGAVVLSSVVFAVEVLRGNGWAAGVIAAVSFALAAIPEEFALVYTLYLALGASRLARDGALVRRLAGVETLGSTTVICTDKTGTLTTGRLQVGAVATPSTGILSSHDVSSGAAVPADVAELLRAAVRACEVDAQDPLDLAVLAFAARAGLDTGPGDGRRLVTDWPFDTADKYLTHVWRDGTGVVVAAKGALEGVSVHASADAASRAAVERAHEAFASAGMRVVAVAAGEAAAPTGDRAGDEATLRLLGLVAFTDPVREGVADALAQCRAAGIRVVMITGDHPTTAHAIAEGLDLPHGDEDGDLIVTGDELAGCAPADAAALVARANVFARVRPEQKHLLVTALRAQGEVVAMTGDGVNDAPALRSADIGVAMGRRGTDVAREAATMVLLDDNFATIVTAARDGRRIYDNLANAFGYLLAFHPPMLAAALLVPLLGRPLLLQPVHLVVLELLLHPIVSLVFQADPAAPDVMARPPRRVEQGLSLRALAGDIGLGVVLAVAVVTAYLLALQSSWSTEQARAFGFTVLVAAQPFLLLVTRGRGRGLRTSGVALAPAYGWAVAAVAATVVVAVEVGPVARLLGFAAFGPGGWLLAVALGAAATLWALVVPVTRRHS